MTPSVDEQIRIRAYQIWEGEGRPAGREFEHWLTAERELRPAPAQPARRARAALAAAAPSSRRRAAPKAANGSRPARRRKEG